MSKNEIRTLSDLFASALQEDQKQIRTLSDLFASALQEDQKQRIREIDFGTEDSLCEVHAIKGRGCYECGQEDHLVKDCPNRKSNNTHNDRSKSHHTYKNQKLKEKRTQLNNHSNL